MEIYKLVDLINIKKIENNLLSYKSIQEKREYLKNLIDAIDSKIRKDKLDDLSIPTIYFTLKPFSKKTRIKIFRKNLLLKSKLRLIELQKEFRNLREKKLEENKYNWMGGEDNLKTLFNNLMKNKFLQKETGINQFLSHFLNGEKPFDNKYYEPLKWNSNESHLVYLINKLKIYDGDVGIIDKGKIWEITSNVFYNKNGEMLKPNVLSVTSWKLKKGDRGIPKDVKDKLNYILASIKK
jgi:hypothetical protein